MLTVIFSIPFPVLVVVGFIVFVFVFDILNAICDPEPMPMMLGGSMFVMVEGMENQGDAGETAGAKEEGAQTQAEYVPYDLKGSDRALMLAQQNAGNINYLKQRVEETSTLRERVDEMKSSMDAMQAQIDGLVQQQAEYAQEIAGSTPPTITGTNLVEEDDSA